MKENTPEDRRENLRTEYQVCQQGASGISASHWTFAGIFLGLSTTVLGLIIPKIFEISGASNIGFKIFVTFICIGMLVIYWALNMLLIRDNKRNQRYFNRMRKIDEITGMEIATEQNKPIGAPSGMLYWYAIIGTLGMFWLITLGFIWSTW